LQADLKSGRRDRLRYHVFDLLYLDGHDLTGATLLDRKSLLERLLRRTPASSPLRYSEHSDENGATMLKHAFNQKLSARRAATIKQYVVDNFKLPHTTLRAVGYGKQRPKNKVDVFAAENRRVEIINETLGVQAQR
jgi:ATP dependent DNA ligase-like protein/OmpA family protein